MKFEMQFVQEIQHSFSKMKALADKALAQLSFEELCNAPDEHSNSIAILIKHMSGNMKSRWTNFLTEDGEKEWRERDQEFEDEFETKEDILACWDSGWEVLMQAIASLTEENIHTTIYIRQEPHTVTQAVLRQHAHYAYHNGQIIQLAKIFKGEAWQSLSIPKGKSDDYKTSTGDYKYTN